MRLVVQGQDVATGDLKALARLAHGGAITALCGTNCEAFRIEHATTTEGVADYCAAAALDFGFVPEGQALTRVRLLAMDMDSTLITIECIDEIADMLGIKPQVAAITARAMRGELDFRQSLAQRLALLEGLDIASLERVYRERLRLSPGADALVAGLRKVGASTLLVSGGFTFFTERLKARLSLDFTLANRLEIRDGVLTGRLEGELVDAEAKAAALRRRRDTLVRSERDLVVAIGDGANDLPMLREADISIAYHAKPIVRAQATYAIDHCGLDAMLNLFV